MTRIFLRISIGVLAAVLVSTIAAINIFEIRTMRMWEENSPAVVRLAKVVLGEIMRNSNDEERDALMRRFSATAEVSVEIVNFEDSRISESARKRLRADKITWVRFWKSQIIKEHGVVVLIPFTGQNKVVAAGPEAPSFTDPFIMISIVAICAVSVFIVGFFLSRGFVGGLRRLEQTAKKITAGDLSARAEVRSKDAVGSLTITFNNMASRIEELLEHQRQLVQAVAHELRTPISSVRFDIEMGVNAAGIEEAIKSIRDIETDLEDLDNLVEELLVFSRYDSGRPTLNPVLVDVRRLINALIARLTPLYPGIHFDFSSHDAKELEVKIDPHSFDRVMNNLVSNAARYAKKKVVVDVEFGEHELDIHVDDDGPGIPVGSRERIFEPFTRLDQSRSRTSGGVGLGLAIVRRIMKVNDGNVSVGISKLGGASFSIHWPISSQQK